MKKMVFIFVILLFSLQAKDISIMSNDGYKLFGKLTFPKIKKSSYPVAIFFHQFGSDHNSWNQLSKALEKEGFATLSVDLRGHGKSIKKNGKIVKVIFDASSAKAIRGSFSKSSKKVGFDKIPSDMSKWIDKISDNKKIDSEHMVAFGSSFGASNLLHIIDDYEFLKIVLISTGKLDKNSIESLEASSSKFLVITSQEDILGAQKSSYKILDNAIDAKMIMLKGSNHGTVLLNSIYPMVVKFITD